MKNIIAIFLFVAWTGCAQAKPLVTITIDTNVIHSQPLVIDEHMVIIDTIIIEKVIEKTFPKATPDQRGDYGKIAAAFFSFVFIIMSIIWGKKKSKNG
jgi:hypothetical protein